MKEKELNIMGRVTTVKQRTEIKGNKDNNKAMDAVEKLYTRNTNTGNCLSINIRKVNNCKQEGEKNLYMQTRYTRNANKRVRPLFTFVCGCFKNGGAEVRCLFVCLFGASLCLSCLLGGGARLCFCLLSCRLFVLYTV